MKRYEQGMNMSAPAVYNGRNHFSDATYSDKCRERTSVTFHNRSSHGERVKHLHLSMLRVVPSKYGR